jgi:hypothetical protein
MPQMVLHNIVSELQLFDYDWRLRQVSYRAITETVTNERLANAPLCTTVRWRLQLQIYLVATSGTTGRRAFQCLRDAAYLSMFGVTLSHPMAPDMRVIYVFAIWELFRPLRKGAGLWFPQHIVRSGKLADFSDCKRHR